MKDKQLYDIELGINTLINVENCRLNIKICLVRKTAKVSSHSGALAAVSRFFFFKLEKKIYQFFLLIV